MTAATSRWLAYGALALAFLVQSACVPSLVLSTAQAPAAQAPPAPLARLTVSATKTEVLQPLTLSADGLPADKAGGPDLDDRRRRLADRGLLSVPRQALPGGGRPWGEARTDANGRLEVALTVPEDYGGVHEVLASVDGTPTARGAVEVVQSFSISGTDGPIGSPIEITARGLGWRTMESTWVLLWDNQSTGWVSGVDTRGTATARLRAAGPAGPHHVKLWSGWQGQAYLNPQQAPTWYLPRPEWTFTTTAEPADVVAFVEPYPDQRQFALTALGRESGANIAPAQGPILTDAVLAARGLPAGTEVRCRLGAEWSATVWRARASVPGRDARHRRVAADGSLRFPFTVPDDLGGAHPIRLLADGRELASAAFVVETSLVSVTPAVVRRGETFEIQLKGVGWTEYDNILNVTYDNA